MVTLHNMAEAIVPKKKLGRNNVMSHQLNKWFHYLTSIRYTCTAPQREICALLKYYAAYSGNSWPTFRDNISVPSSRISFYFLTLEDGTDRLSRNVGKDLPLYAATNP